MTELMYSPKIKPEHLTRKAIVYLRQSSEKQVRQNKESQRLQLDLSIITMMSGYCSWAIFPIWARIARKRWNLMCTYGKQAAGSPVSLRRTLLRLWIAARFNSVQPGLRFLRSPQQ